MGDMEVTEMDHPSHPHPLQLKPAGAPFKCSGCLELGFGPSYRCENRRCNYILHEECAKADSPAFHRFFPKSYFEFYEKPPGLRGRYCDACGKDVLGFVYHCSRTGNDLHPCCLKLKDNISEGYVTLKLCHKVSSKCQKCKSREVENGVGGWCYKYSGDNSCYHVSCMKELILEKWKRGYFSQENNDSIQVSDHRESQLALASIEMVQSGRRSRRLGKITMYTKIAVVVFKLIFSAIFGNPISAIAALVEALVQD